jgi:hypothetical protein
LALLDAKTAHPEMRLLASFLETSKTRLRGSLRGCLLRFRHGQVFADWAGGPLAHLPSGVLPANAAWLALAAISHNLLRAAGSLASLACAKARGATLRHDLIDVAARTARHGRGHLTVHLPEGWHRQTEWMNLFEAAFGPPAKVA